MRKLFFISAGILSFLVCARITLAVVFSPHLYDGEYVDFQTQILSVPQKQYQNISFPVLYKNSFGFTQITILTPEDNLNYGQTVRISGKIKPRVLKNNKTVFMIKSPSIQVLHAFPEAVMGWGQSIREKVASIYQEYLSQNDSSLLLGIVLGVKGTFSQNLLDGFKSTGVMHVIAASGMNVTLVGSFLISFLGRFLKRQYVSVIAVVAIGIYCILAGLQSSIIRAGIMTSFALIAQLYGRQYSGLYGLFLAACGMLLLSPLSIVDVGFQLSFTATLGILLLKPLMPRLFGDDISTTVAAQIATLPILLTTFGQYGVLSIIVNALVLWVIPPLMIVGGVAAAIGLVFHQLGSVLAVIGIPLLWYFEKVILFFGNVDWVLTINSFPGILIAGYYGIILSIVVFAWKKKKEILLTDD